MSGDLLSSLLNDAGSQSGSSQSGGDPLSALLSGLMGGGGAQSTQGGDVLGSLLGGLMGGGETQGAQGGDVLGSLLGGLMGGGGAQGAQQGAGDLGGLMGGGGAQGAQGGDVLGSLLGGLLGGGVQGGQQTPTASAGISSHPFLAPIVNGLAKKLGLPPAIAEVVVSFALTQLLNSLMNRASTGGATGMQSFAGSQRAGEVAGDLQMEDISQRFQSGLAIDTQYLRSAGLSQQLADQTGLDQKTAAASLEQAFQLLGSAPGSEQ
jgi:hypothetical protein